MPKYISKIKVDKTTALIKDSTAQQSIATLQQNVSDISGDVTDIMNEITQRNAEEPINVLTLGIKNDGTEDISTIFNAQTQLHALYFPAGTYLVSHPLYPHYDVYGAGSANAWVSAMGTTHSTYFIDGLDEVLANSDNAMFNLGSIHTTELKDFTVKLNTNNRAIDINNASYGIYSIKDISIINVNTNYAISLRPQVMDSKLVTIENVKIYGKPQALDHKGIYLNSNATDCHINNTYIMGIHKGIVSEDNVLFLSDVHIWCGKNGFTADTDSWWSNTRGVSLHGSKLIAQDLYIDTAFLPIASNSWETIFSINNIFIWYDDNEYSTSYDSSLFYQYGRGVINGGLIYGHDRMVNVFGANISFCNVKVIVDDAITFTNKWGLFPVYPKLMNNYYSIALPIPQPSSYAEVMRIKYNGNCSIKAILTDSTGDSVELNIHNVDNVKSYNKVTRAGSMALYIKDTGTEFIIYQFYLYQFVAEISVNILSTNFNAFVLNYNFVQFANGDEYTHEYTQSSSGLTEITEAA